MISSEQLLIFAILNRTVKNLDIFLFMDFRALATHQRTDKTYNSMRCATHANFHLCVKRKINPFLE